MQVEATDEWNRQIYLTIGLRPDMKIPQPRIRFSCDADLPIPCLIYDPISVNGRIFNSV
jgi:hypothetical protein